MDGLTTTLQFSRFCDSNCLTSHMLPTVISAQVSPDLVARSNNSTPMKCRTLELGLRHCTVCITVYLYPFFVNQVSYSSRSDTLYLYRQVWYEEMHLVSRHFWKPCVVDDSVIAYYYLWYLRSITCGYFTRFKHCKTKHLLSITDRLIVLQLRCNSTTLDISTGTVSTLHCNVLDRENALLLPSDSEFNNGGKWISTW